MRRLELYFKRRITTGDLHFSSRMAEGGEAVMNDIRGMAISSAIWILYEEARRARLGVAAVRIEEIAPYAAKREKLRLCVL